MATREEKHSTRGRAHLLWEMMQGKVITDGWRNEEVKEALDRDNFMSAEEALAWGLVDRVNGAREAA